MLKFLLNIELVEIELLRILASICCFFMWTKSFYWLRLFTETAYFVKLITETFEDIKVFSMIMLIIILAFANSFILMDSDKDKPIIG